MIVSALSCGIANHGEQTVLLIELVYKDKQARRNSTGKRKNRLMEFRKEEADVKGNESDNKKTNE